MESYWKRGFVTLLLPVENPFFAIVVMLCVANGLPLGCQWRPNGTQVGANWHNTRLTGSIGAGL